MRKSYVVSALVAVFLIPSSIQLFAHCEVPCGVYGDQRRFEEMLEDTTTIARGIDKIHEIIESMDDGPSPLAVNQVSRWVSTKENHATNVQHIISQPTHKYYFQRSSSIGFLSSMFDLEF